MIELPTKFHVGKLNWLWGLNFTRDLVMANLTFSNQMSFFPRHFFNTFFVGLLMMEQKVSCC